MIHIMTKAQLQAAVSQLATEGFDIPDLDSSFKVLATAYELIAGEGVQERNEVLDAQLEQELDLLAF